MRLFVGFNIITKDKAGEKPQTNLNYLEVTSDSKFAKPQSHFIWIKTHQKEHKHLLSVQKKHAPPRSMRSKLQTNVGFPWSGGPTSQPSVAEKLGFLILLGFESTMVGQMVSVDHLSLFGFGLMFLFDLACWLLLVFLFDGFFSLIFLLLLPVDEKSTEVGANLTFWLYGETKTNWLETSLHDVLLGKTKGRLWTRDFSSLFIRFPHPWSLSLSRRVTQVPPKQIQCHQ